MKYKESTLQETIKDINSSPQYCMDEHYIYWTAVTTPWRGKRVVQIMNNYFSKKAKILDVGSSQALTLGYTAQVFPNIQGLDVDPIADKIAKKRLKRLGLKTKTTVYNGEKIPFTDNTFDGIVCTEVFEHVDNPQRFIKELYRVLKPDSYLIISAPNKLYPIDCEFHLPLLSYLPKNLADIYIRLSGKGQSYDHVNHPTYKKFTQTVGAYFKCEDITFNIIKNNKQYFLDKERGNIVPHIAKLISLLDKLENTPIDFISKYTKLLLSNFSAGWFLVGKKR